MISLSSFRLNYNYAIHCIKLVSCHPHPNPSLVQLFSVSISNWYSLLYLTKDLQSRLTKPFLFWHRPMIADGLVEAERVTKPELAAVSGAGGESRGFEGRSRAQAAAGGSAVTAVTSAAAPGQLWHWAVSKASLPPGQPIDVRWTLAVDWQQEPCRYTREHSRRMGLSVVNGHLDNSQENHK